MQANRASSNDDDDSDGSSVDLAFASMDMAGVNFEQDANAMDPALLEWECNMAFQRFNWISSSKDNEEEDPWKASKEKAANAEVLRLAKLISEGKYTELLKTANVATALFQNRQTTLIDASTTAIEYLKHQTNEILSKASQDENGDGVFWELEMIGVAALNLFLQSNYTGPTLDEKNKDNYQYLADVNPHPGPLMEILQRKGTPAHATTSTNIALSEPADKGSEEGETEESPVEEILVRETLPFHHAILTELAVDGEWPCPVCENPYFLLVALVILETLAESSSNPFHGIHVWYARVLVAHLRLLQVRVGEAPPTLEEKLDRVFDRCIATFEEKSNGEKVNTEMATILLERGLADHHLDRPQKGRQFFEQAQGRSGLEVEVTGVYGKRTKFQQENKAQMTVRAKSTAIEQSTSISDENKTKEDTSNLMVEQPEDSILLERIKYDDEKENEIQPLNMLDQSILLALCLDVKNKNPSKEALTAEEMGAFLARVLDHVDDWMIYATALLERSWLEFERSHAKERAILQMQALADQHTNRLTFTQSTKESVENAAPVQERLKHLHMIVYPPRWAMIEEIADRYAGMGIVTSAAELYTEIALWEDVVDCYTRAGKRQKAEQVVRQQLSKHETPRMWTALGDLTQDIAYYERAIEVSNKRYAKAYTALAQHYFEKQDLLKAYENYDEALKLKPLTPHVWFRFGTLSMQLERWDSALKAFSEVVRQEPEEAEAWANVAAVHMHNRNPAEAYPALNESLKQNRNNWRVWVSKLYTCLDLQKYDEATQACNVILDLREAHAQSDGVPEIEEKCVKAIVGGTIHQYRTAQASPDKYSVESARRSILRVHGLLDRIGSTSASTMPWVFESLAYLHEEGGADDKALEYLMQEYRTLQGVPGWETEPGLRIKMYNVVAHIVGLRKLEGSKDALVKSRMLLRQVKKKIEDSVIDASKTPDEVDKVAKLLEDVEERIQELK